MSDPLGKQPAVLTPEALAEVMQVTMRIGTLMLSSGTSSYRVKQAMRAVAATLGMERLTAHVMLTEITDSGFSGPYCHTEVGEIATIGVNANRLAALEQLYLTLPVTVTPSMVAATLDRIAALQPLYSVSLTAIAVGLACGAFAALNAGGMVEFIAASVGAGIGQALRSQLLRRRLNQFAVTLCCAILAAGAYYLIVQGLMQFGLATPNHAAGYMSSVLFLVPGFPLVTAALDLARLDFSAGVSRIAYGLMLLTAGAIGVWFISTVAGLAPAPLLSPPDWKGMTVLLTVLLTVLFRVSMSFLAVLGFAILFNTPSKTAGVAAGLGAIGNVLRLALHDWGLALEPATLIGALSVGLLSSWTSARLHKPRILLSLPGIIVMVPGIPAYKTITFINQGEILEALQSALQAGFIVGAIGIGLGLARILTDPEWGFEK